MKTEGISKIESVTRLEVIDSTGRAYVHYLDEKESVRYSLQDDNRTLKIFIVKALDGGAAAYRDGLKAQQDLNWDGQNE
tara:strand:- start:396 stop:632 length:237 start_codon:yes stop_codon:yes gene_type:complete